MNDERSSSPAPADSVPAEQASAPANAPSQRPPSSPDVGRVPSIAGLVPPRFPGRLPREAALRSAVPSDSQGLMRPQLPNRKPMSTPPAEAASPEATAPWTDDEPSADSSIFSGATVRPSSRPRKLVPPPKPVTVSSPTAAANSSGTGMAPRRHGTPPPYNASTITAMRIISIGVEDKPLPSEYATPSTLSDRVAEQEHALLAPLPSFETSEELTEPLPARAPEAPHDAPLEPAAALAPLPAFETPIEPGMLTGEGLAPGFETAAAPLENLPPERREPDLAAAPLPAFDLPQDEPVAAAPLPQFDLPQAEPQESAAAPLPQFDLPQAEPQESAAAPLPEFDRLQAEPPDLAATLPSLELPEPRRPRSVPPPKPNGLAVSKPADAPQDLAPKAPPPPPESGSEIEQTPLLQSQPNPVEPVELAEDDVAPDSSQREGAPPRPPTRTSTKPRSEPPGPPARTAPAAAAATQAGDATEGVGAATKRNPPPPPRRSFPAPNEVLAAATGTASAPVAEVAAPASPEIQVDKPKSEEKAQARTRHPWWEELFNEDYSRALSRLSDEQIKREATFIEESLGVAEGGVLLDLGCGPGYHAVELAERGYAVVGYDLSLYQLALAADVAQERHQKLNLMQGDMREMAFEGVFDGIYCWNTTFGYFEEDKNLAVAERIFEALKPGGTFLLDVINRDFVTMQQPSSVWFEGDSAVCMDDMTVDFISSRLRVRRSLMLDDGRTRECPYSIRLYSLHELGKLLHDVGFRVAEASGDPSTPGVFMGQTSPRIIILAQRP